MTQTRTELPPLMQAGDLALDPWMRLLIGPTGSAPLGRAVFLLLSELMRRPGATVEKSKLISVLWPDPDDEPPLPERALHKRICDARRTLEAVGVSRERIQLDFLIGYRLIPADADRRVVRLFTLEQAAQVDALIAARSAPAETAR